jgi:hypothetical protein
VSGTSTSFDVPAPFVASYGANGAGARAWITGLRVWRGDGIVCLLDHDEER